jgi:hypothetical protein
VKNNMTKKITMTWRKKFYSQKPYGEIIYPKHPCSLNITLVSMQTQWNSLAISKSAYKAPIPLFWEM